MMMGNAVGTGGAGVASTAPTMDEAMAAMTSAMEMMAAAMSGKTGNGPAPTGGPDMGVETPSASMARRASLAM